MKREINDLINRILANLYLAPTSYLDTFQSETKINDIEFAELLTGCISEELKRHKTYYNLKVLVPRLIDLHKNASPENKNRISSYLKDAYHDLLIKLKFCAKNHKDNHQAEIITIAISTLEQYALSETGKLTTDKDKLEFIWYILNEERSLEFFNIINKYSNAFINVFDENLHSLFYLLAERYLESYDEYYLSAIAALLENNNFIFNVSEANQVKSQIALKKMAKDADAKLLQKLEGLIEHYIKPDKIANSIDSVSTSTPKVEVQKEEVIKSEIKRRADYRNLKTFTFSQSGISDIAVSAELSDGNLILYCHIIDLAGYVSIGSLADERARHQSKATLPFFPLFNKSFMNDTVLFKKNSDALALTVKVTLDKDLKILDVEPSESVITVDTAFAYMPLINAIRREESDIIAITDLVARLKKERGADEKEFIINAINKEISILVNRAIAKYMSERDKPFIYQNISLRSPLEKEADYEAISKITRYLWDSRVCLSIDKWYSKVPDEKVVYSKTFKENVRHGVPYGLITEPQKQFVALENIRLLKIFALGADPELSEACWSQRIAEDASIATALSSRDLKNDKEIKKLLLNN